MKFKTITIGGGNKNFFFSKCCLEFLILNCLKNQNIEKHIHIGHIPKIRIYFLYLLLTFNKVPFSKFEYMNQIKNLNLLTKYSRGIVISSAPLVGSLTILRCWESKLPVLIFDPQIYYINFSTFLPNQFLVWRNFGQLSKKLNKVISNYQKYSMEYFSHYKFLKYEEEASKHFLINNSINKYKIYKQKGLIYGKIKPLLIIITFLLKIIYVILKMLLIIFYLYLRPLFKVNK